MDEAVLGIIPSAIPLTGEGARRAGCGGEGGRNVTAGRRCVPSVLGPSKGLTPASTSQQAACKRTHSNSHENSFLEIFSRLFADQQSPMMKGTDVSFEASLRLRYIRRSELSGRHRRCVLAQSSHEVQGEPSGDSGQKKRWTPDPTASPFAVPFPKEKVFKQTATFARATLCAPSTHRVP